MGNQNKGHIARNGGERSATLEVIARSRSRKHAVAGAVATEPVAGHTGAAHGATCKGERRDEGGWAGGIQGAPGICTPAARGKKPGHRLTVAGRPCSAGLASGAKGNEVVARQAALVAEEEARCAGRATPLLVHACALPGEAVHAVGSRPQGAARARALQAVGCAGERRFEVAGTGQGWCAQVPDPAQARLDSSCSRRQGRCSPLTATQGSWGLP